ncbi:hypothetical protein [Mesobacillus zeae]|uniref:Uncharacterized protein n=1 Tax=Mesobacillus zeae TaxID=1917180 RepID=A0A398AYB8_9BACI|nr:hypothetical protein [Mesobacillus zeae]RID82572.1 hypothetical protein D1970_18635 [Mesobacillus zeae]
MAYIMENARVQKGNLKKNVCLLVEGSKITAIREAFPSYTHCRMELDSYIMTPTFAVFDMGLPLGQTFGDKKSYYLKNFIKRGCTTVLTCVPITSAATLEAGFRKATAQLTDCPVDYVLGARIPASLLTPSFIRKCKHAKIPALFVDVGSQKDIVSLPWGWIREAMFPYNSPLIPVFKSGDPTLKALWARIMKKEKIPSMLHELEEHLPAEMEALQKIGIYPGKCNLQHGGEVSYNLYLRNGETEEAKDTGELFMKHEDKLSVSVHKGVVIRAGSQVHYRPGYGEYIVITTPAFHTAPV